MASGDYQIDFSGLADIDPYVNADFTFVDVNCKIVSGVLVPASAAEARAIYNVSALTAETIDASVNINGDSTLTFDPRGTGLFKSNGEGYLCRVSGSAVYLDSVNTSGTRTTLDGATGLTFADSSLVKLSLNTTTNALTVSLNGADIITTTDTTYQRNEGVSEFYGGIYLNFDNANAGGVEQFAVTGFAAANSAPVVNDQTFSVADSASNGTVIGTLAATDSDGTVDSYAISGTTLAINSTTGQITLADNAGIVAGTPITATVTVTDNNGDTDTATVTVNVTNSGLIFDCYDADNSNAAITSETLSHVRVLDPADLSEVATATNISISGAGSAEIDTDSVTIGTDYLVIARRANGDVCEPFLVSAIDLAAP